MAQIQLYDPFADTPFDELFRGVFRPVRAMDGEGPRAIKVDVTETDASFVVHAEVPGVPKNDIQVTIEGNQVTIGAEVKRDIEKKDGERVLRTERYRGSLFRSFTLPADIDQATSEARYENGVLELKLAKKAAVAARKLAIQ